jgi:hypothetical protein
MNEKMYKRKSRKMKKISICILLLLVGITVFPQSYYHDFIVSTSIFYDGFEDNQNNWDISDNAQIRQQVYDGKYHFESKNNQSQITWKTINIDYSSNFEIEALISYHSGTQNNSYGFFWGKSELNNNMFSFFFSATGFYRIDKQVNGVFEPFVDWQESELVNKFSFNKLTVRKIDNTVYYYLNENYVFEHIFYEPYGNQIGFHVTNNAAILIDYLNVSYIQPN